MAAQLTIKIIQATNMNNTTKKIIINWR